MPQRQMQYVVPYVPRVETQMVGMIDAAAMLLLLLYVEMVKAFWLNPVVAEDCKAEEPAKTEEEEPAKIEEIKGLKAEAAEMQLRLRRAGEDRAFARAAGSGGSAQHQTPQTRRNGLGE